MPTEKQISANRANAKKSTGPVTAAGKERASLNALRHGMYSQRVVLQYEHAPHYDELRENLLRSWQPVNAQEKLLVEQIAQAAWRLQRAYRVETGTFDLWLRDLCHKAGVGGENPHGDEGLAIVFKQNKFDLDRLRRYIVSTERIYERLIQQLQSLQQTRKKLASFRTPATRPQAASAGRSSQALGHPDPPASPSECTAAASAAPCRASRSRAVPPQSLLPPDPSPARASPPLS